MRKIGILMALLLVPMIAFAYAPAINVSVARYEPFPAQAGHTADIWLKIDNTGDAAANLTVGLQSQYPYTVLSNPSEIGILGSYESYYIRQRIAISPDAPQGEAKLKIWYSSNGINVSQEKEILIENSPEFRISEIGTAQTGEFKNITLEITPLRSSAKAVNIVLGGGFYVQGPSRMYIGDVEKGETKKVSVFLKPRQSGDIGTLNVTLNYEYGNSVKASESVPVGIRTLDIADVFADSKQVQGGYEIEVVNRGYGTAKFLTVSCNTNPEVNYVGNLVSDDFDSFTVQPVSEKIKCNITYEDSEGSHQKEFSFDAMQEKKANYLIPALLAAGIAGFVLWRLVRK